jgi:hypothetical protein
VIRGEPLSAEAESAYLVAEYFAPSGRVLAPDRLRPANARHSRSRAQPLTAACPSAVSTPEITIYCRSTSRAKHDLYGTGSRESQAWNTSFAPPCDRLEELYAQLTGRPRWIVVPKGAEVSENVVVRTEGTSGGALCHTGPNSYADGNGNPVQTGAPTPPSPQ